MLLRSIGALFITAALSACGEETAAKVAPWIGTKTLVESKADSFAKFALDKAEWCERFRANAVKFTECIQPAIKDAKQADDLYIRDCKNGNDRACKKRERFYKAWDTGR